ncbi:TIGR02301 family protein [Mesorhizobium sp. NBSH29]|uniref:TIGR02301 family protein n=1 Tax=Mesorhizobium sp. NBSH29 TaxID=2654249 RepID=UPI00189645E6|nr:TIGR02301 family protein [Mesorhizobium sp. NBSH29]QPC87283.1 TIGR02301 family protein [Mesorhizobium sp. NBSH29]
MILGNLIRIACLASLLVAGGPVARASEAPFEGQLMRLAEILGSLHYLRNLCGETGKQWRTEMERLLEVEKPESERRAKFVANFNHGYRSFEQFYASCTASASEAISRYMKEGEELSREIVGRYGN